MEKHTIDILTKLCEGESIPLTKSETDEVSSLIPKLKNFGILYQPNKFSYVTDSTGRKKIAKLIELNSWTKFKDWLNNQNTSQYTNNNFSGSNIGQINQATERIDLSDQTIQNISPNAPKEKKEKSWMEKLAWIIGIIAGLAAIYEFVFKEFLS